MANDFDAPIMEEKTSLELAGINSIPTDYNNLINKPISTSAWLLDVQNVVSNLFTTTSWANIIAYAHGLGRIPKKINCSAKANVFQCHSEWVWNWTSQKCCWNWATAAWTQIVWIDNVIWNFASGSFTGYITIWWVDETYVNIVYQDGWIKTWYPSWEVRILLTIE